MRTPAIGELHVILFFALIMRALCTTVFAHLPLLREFEDGYLYGRWLGQLLMFSALLAIPAYLYGLRGQRLSEIVGPAQRPMGVLLACLWGGVLYAFAVGQHGAETFLIAQFDPQAAYSRWPYHPGVSDPVWSPLNLAVVLLIATTLGPLAEEFFVRALLVDTLRRKYGKHPTALYSSFLFILLHYRHPYVVSTLVFALGLAYLYMHTGSLTLCVAVHSSYNMLAWIHSNVGLEAQARALEALHRPESWTAELMLWLATGGLILHGALRSSGRVFAPERTGAGKLQEKTK